MVYIVTLALVLPLGPMPAAQAEIIGTPVAVAAYDRAASMDRIAQALDREQVRKRLLAHGVERSAVDARLAALTDAELADLATRLDSAPAGGDLLGVIGAVFVVLLILELVGVIDIFKTVGPARR
jgi:hypothetical protein